MKIIPDITFMRIWRHPKWEWISFFRVKTFKGSPIIIIGIGKYEIMFSWVEGDWK